MLAQSTPMLKVNETQIQSLEPAVAEAELCELVQFARENLDDESSDIELRAAVREVIGKIEAVGPMLFSTRQRFLTLALLLERPLFLDNEAVQQHFAESGSAIDEEVFHFYSDVVAELERNMAEV